MKNSCIQLKVSCLLQSSGIHLDLNISKTKKIYITIAEII